MIRFPPAVAVLLFKVPCNEPLFWGLFLSVLVCQAFVKQHGKERTFYETYLNLAVVRVGGPMWKQKNIFSSCRRQSFWRLDFQFLGSSFSSSDFSYNVSGLAWLQIGGVDFRDKKFLFSWSCFKFKGGFSLEVTLLLYNPDAWKINLISHLSYVGITNKVHLSCAYRPNSICHVSSLGEVVACATLYFRFKL